MKIYDFYSRTSFLRQKPPRPITTTRTKNCIPFFLIFTSK
uniref:Uncharacterized protein n=1 Tax=viral metagenome TaxID=1070528 RepID=A0A6C0IE63_9ZZZZ